MGNDLWWCHFNASGTQSFLVDLANSHLSTVTSENGSHALVDLFAASSRKDHSKLRTPIQSSPTYARAILYTRRTDLDTIVTSLRLQIATPSNVFTQYCWLDFNRTWETAHTDARQTRCYSQYQANGAVYWEGGMRNVDSTTLQALYGGPTGAFTTAIIHAILKNATGQAFLDQVAACKGAVPVADEVAYWRRHGIEYYHLTLQNLFGMGIVETIDVVNAIGLAQRITIKRENYQLRGSAWTSILMNWHPYNDLAFSQYVGISNIRSDPLSQRFFDDCKPNGPSCATVYDTVLGLNKSWPFVQIFHRHVGQFGSVDMHVQAVPASLVQFATSVKRLIHVHMQSNDGMVDAFQALQPFELDPVPSAWIQPAGTMVYLGGDPTCPSRKAMPFVQSSWAFDVDCNVQTPQTMRVTNEHLLFAVAATALDQRSSVISLRQVAEICAECTTASEECREMVTATSKLLLQLVETDEKSSKLGQDLPVLWALAKQEVQDVNVGIIQFAINQSATHSSPTNVLLHQPLISASPWSFFGYIQLFEWAQGLREVVSFQGDVATYVLISDVYTPKSFYVQPLEVPSTACLYLWYVAVYVTFALGGVASMMLLYGVSLNLRFVGRNLYQFNRVAGSVWVGRPFLVVRSVTAAILLSTSRIELVQTNGYTRFDENPRPWLDTVIITSEVTWLTYVLHDVLLVVLDGSDHDVVRAASWIAWVVCGVVELVYPVQVDFKLHRDCFSVDLMLSSQCHSGQLTIGSSSRMWLLAGVNAGAVVMCTLGAKLMERAPTISKDGPVVLPGAAVAFLTNSEKSSRVWLVDHLSCCMCGLLRYRTYLFDIKRWDLSSNIPTRRSMTVLEAFSSQVLAPSPASCLQDDVLGAAQVKTRRRIMRQLFGVFGWLYMSASIFGSISFIVLSEVHLANDFWWTGFNASTTHAYISNLLNVALHSAPEVGRIDLSDGRYWDMIDYDASTSRVQTSPLYPALVHDEVKSNVVSVIRGLRRMDACLIPAISTQYCWVDFEKQWELANTAKRQERCLRGSYVSNGAVYLASGLRNAWWPRLRECWGHALDVAIANDLRATVSGAQWWSNVQDIATTVDDESAVWRQFGVVEYTAAWQNSKSLGVVETYAIENAFGIVYPMTLKSTNGSTNALGSSASVRAYWNLASDLHAILTPLSPVANQSLIRSSNRFAFANTSMFNVLAHNGSVDWPLDPAFAAFESSIGPLGSVDLKYVSRPQSLLTYMREASIVIKRVVRTSTAAYRMYVTLDNIPSYIPSMRFPSPRDALNAGGNILCPWVMASPTNVNKTLTLLFGLHSACASAFQGEYVNPNNLQLMLALVGSGLVRPNVTIDEITLRCTNVSPIRVATCVSFTRAALRFLLNTTYFPDPSVLAPVVVLAQQAQRDIQAINIEVAQWMATPRRQVQLAHASIFGDDVSFHIHAWHLMVEWADLKRDVVAFEGDVGSLVLVSTKLNLANGVLNTLEVPVNVAYFMRVTCSYITGVMGCIGLVCCAYIAFGRFHVEWWNLIELNRIAGAMWIGRPLLFLRSVTAMAMLSTGSLDLVTKGGFNYLVQGAAKASTLMHVVTTIIASGEVLWLVYVIQDILIVYTKQYTSMYAPKCNILIWFLTVLLSLVAPVTPSASIARSCQVDAVDWQLTCASAVVAIGSVQRFWSLIALSIGASVLCYVVERVRHPALEPMTQSSLFLPACARYMFDSTDWVYRGVYHLDIASAAIAGLLAFPHAQGFYLLDIKTWKIYHIGVPDAYRHDLRANRPHLLRCIPLTN